MKQNEIIQLKNNVLRTLARILRLMDPGSKEKLNFSLGGGSFTDGSMIQIGLDEGFFEENKEAFKAYTEAIGHTPEYVDGWAAAMGYGIHEKAHCLFTDFNTYKAFGEWFQKTFAHCGTTQLHMNVIHQFGMKFNNAIEDGRIENFVINMYPGSAKYLAFLRNMHWNLDKGQNPSETCQFMMTCCYWATMGLRPQYYDKTPKRLQDNFEKIKYDIDSIVSEPSCKKVNEKLKKMFLKIKPYIEELLKKELAEADLMEAIMNLLASMPEEFKGTKASGAKKAEEISKGGGLTITIRQNGSSSGSNSNSDSDSSNESSEGNGSSSSSENGEDSKNSESGDDSSDDKKDEDGKDSKSGEDDKNKKDSKDGENEEESKNGKDKKNSSSSNNSKDGDNKSSKKSDGSNSKRQKAPDYAERGGDESNMSEDSSNTRDNNGQGTNNSGNSAPDDTDETITDTNESLVSSVKESLESLYEEISADAALQQAKNAKEEKQEALSSSSITDAEIEEIRSGYGNSRVEGYKAVKVTSKANTPPEITTKGRLFRREIEKTLQTQNDIYLRGTRSGKINRPSLHKIAQNDFNLFQKKIEPNKTNAAIAICWDGSGSMSGSKQNQSTIACAIIEEGLKGLVPLKIVNFTTTFSNMVHHYIVKDFNDNDKSHNYAYSYGVSRSFSGGNKDGYSIKVLTKELEKRSEEQKILIVLSDGLPSDYPSLSTAMNDVYTAVKTARKKGIEVISIMFGEQGFRESEYDNYIKMYESGVISSDPSQIQSELVKLIKKKLFN